MNERVKIYEERIQRLLNLFNALDPNWMLKREWVESMLEFELGDDFYVTFLENNNGDGEYNDIQNFQASIVNPWIDSYRKKNNYNNDEEESEDTEQALDHIYKLGLCPEVKADSVIYQEELMFLDYAWWCSIKKIIPSLNAEEKGMLDEKQLELEKSF